MSIVMVWMVNSMKDDISNNYMYFTIAKAIWEDCKTMYSDMENTSQIPRRNDRRDTAGDHRGFQNVGGYKCSSKGTPTTQLNKGVAGATSDILQASPSAFTGRAFLGKGTLSWQL
ncbi:hypothetical protein LIER_36864 [Lithospermum erythrorhizon]|uniref:Uncharacterized protein n=1 Tax=Lithospermum erythrorhizon TaxID=34254 RepID=A0AAV3PCI1_LITER